jgi:hypothetical protein
MKSIILLFAVLFSSLSFASDLGNQDIYNALDVEEYNESPAFGSMDFVKEVSGLKCSRMYFGEGFLFDCALEADHRAEDIYNVLNVEAVNESPAYGSMDFVKEVGGLRCSKAYFGEGFFYSCELTAK